MGCAASDQSIGPLLVRMGGTARECTIDWLVNFQRCINDIAFSFIVLKQIIHAFDRVSIHKYCDVVVIFACCSQVDMRRDVCFCCQAM